MNQNQWDGFEIRPTALASPENTTSEPAPPLEDPRVVRAVEEYLAALEAGSKPDRQEFLSRYPEVAPVLAVCLDSLEFVQAAAPQLHDAAAAPAPAGPSSSVALHPEGPLGDFRLIRQIGRGGMGVVYEAMQISLGRRVALKVLPFASTLDAKQLQRFKNEAYAAAQLHHTNIVPVYATGCERGVHYYAMQYIEGQTLAALIRELRMEADLEDRGQTGEPGCVSARRGIEDRGSKIEDRQAVTDDYQPAAAPANSTLEARGPANDTAITEPRSSLLDLRSSSVFRTVAQLGIQAAEALEYAHQMGIIHRDIKPGNLLVETPPLTTHHSPLTPGHSSLITHDSPLRLWITDFGLAHCQSQAGLTMTGDLIGTLRYMSPEQALAKRVLVDHRTDIYSLGATLYELLTLEPAFPGGDRQELLRQIAFEEPRRLRRINKSIPMELETIVSKAMEKNPNDRYVSAQELAEDLRRFLEDKPIRARRAGPWKRSLMWARRRPALAGLMAASVLAAVALIGLGVGLWFNAQLQVALKDADEHRQDADTQRQKAEQAQYSQHIALAQAEWQNSNIGRLGELLDKCPPGYQDNWEWRYLKRQCRPESIAFTGHQGGVAGVAFHPKGTQLATASIDGTMRLWDAATGQELFSFPRHPTELCRVAYSPDGKRVAFASADRLVKVWDVASRHLVFTLEGHAMDVYGLAFSRDGKRIATGSFDKTVRVWDAATGKEILPRLEGHTAEIYFVAFSPDGQRIASASFDKTVRVWDAAEGKLIFPLKGHSAFVYGVAFSPDGKQLATASQDQTVRIWDAKTGQEIRTLKGHSNEVISVVFRPDGKRIASAGADRTIKIWDPATGQELLSLKGHGNVIFDLAFSPDGTRLASGSQDRTVRLWDATTTPEARTLPGHGAEVSGATFSPDGTRLATASLDKTVKLWDATTVQILVTIPHSGEVAAVAFSPDGKWIASAGADQKVQIWDASNGRAFRSLSGHAGEVRCVAYSPDGKRLASADAKGIVKVWETTAGKEIFSREAHVGEARSVDFSSDGTQLASSGADRSVKIWDAMNGQMVQSLGGHHCWVHGVAFSRDWTRLATAGPDRPSDAAAGPLTATRLASGSGDGSVQIWDPTTGQKTLPPIQAHGGYVRGVAFHPTEARLATAATDRTLKLWDVNTGQEVLTLQGHASGVTCVAFSRDGTRLVSGDMDGTVRIWDARPWTPEIQVERQALGLLDALFAKPLNKAEVIAYLRSSRTIRSEARDKALVLVERYPEKSMPDPLEGPRPQIDGQAVEPKK